MTLYDWKREKKNWKTNAKKHGQVFDTSTHPSPSRSIALVQRLQKILWSKCAEVRLICRRYLKCLDLSTPKRKTKWRSFCLRYFLCSVCFRRAVRDNLPFYVNISLDLLQLHKFVAQTLASATCNTAKPEIFLLRKCVISSELFNRWDHSDSLECATVHSARANKASSRSLNTAVIDVDLWSIYGSWWLFFSRKLYFTNSKYFC